MGPVAQVVEQLTFNQWVEGSNPSGLTIIRFFVFCLLTAENLVFLSLLRLTALWSSRLE